MSWEDIIKLGRIIHPGGSPKCGLCRRNIWPPQSGVDDPLWGTLCRECAKRKGLL